MPKVRVNYHAVVIEALKDLAEWSMCSSGEVLAMSSSWICVDERESL